MICPFPFPVHFHSTHIPCQYTLLPCSALCPEGAHRALLQERELAGRVPEPLAEQRRADIVQVILPQVQLCQAGAGAEHRGQVLAATGREAAADQPVGETDVGPQSSSPSRSPGAPPPWVTGV